MIRNAIRRPVSVLLGVTLLLAVSVGFSAVQAQEGNAVIIKNFMFSPMAITVKAGSTVTWKNLDGEPHVVVSDTGLFRSSALDQNEIFQYKFDKPGVYKIFCGIHPNMRATVTVQ
jgi:plastocyanin